MSLEGFVRTCLGGFYTVETEDGLYTCRARGRFRREGASPCAGDRVEIQPQAGGTGALTAILPRKNYLPRPQVSNLDRLFIVASVVEPTANTLLIDKAVAAAELNGIEPVVIFTKGDLAPADRLWEVYSSAGIECRIACAKQRQGLEAVQRLAEGKVSAFIGNSGVGKSTLLNGVFPWLSLPTGEISQKLGRGRHTTRQVEFFKLEDGGYVADTPGFSTFDMERYSLTDRERIAEGFREFGAYTGSCQFKSCSHTCEKGCAVLSAVREGKIARSRLESYVAMYQEIKDVKQWQQKSKRV